MTPNRCPSCPAGSQFHGHAGPVARCPHVPRRRRVGAHAKWQQQCLLSGQRDLLVRLGERRRQTSSPGPGPSSTCAASTLFFGGGAFFRAARCASCNRTGAGRHRLVPPRRAPMTDSDWGVGYAKSLGVLLNGSSLSVPDRHGRQWPTRRFTWPSMRGTSHFSSRLPVRSGEGRGTSWSTAPTANQRKLGASSKRESLSSFRGTTSSCWSAPHEPDPFSHAEREPRCTTQKNKTSDLQLPGTTTLRSEFWLLFVLTTLRPEDRELEMGQKL